MLTALKITSADSIFLNFFILILNVNEILQHKNKEVNFKLWREAQTYGDIQLMPFVDYYSLLTYKTIAICILGVTFDVYYTATLFLCNQQAVL